MSAVPSVVKAIRAIRKIIESPPTIDADFELYVAMSTLLRKSEKIAGDAETLAAVLAFAPEIEQFRGKGSQSAAREFSRRIGYLVALVKHRPPIRLHARSLPGRQLPDPAGGRDRVP